MDTILNQIGHAVNKGFPYLAVVSALTLPEICAALESGDGRGGDKKYIAWYDKWAAPKFPMVRGFDMYRLRCGVIHQGRLGPDGMQYDRIVFTGGGRMHGCMSQGNFGIEESALQLDSAEFCYGMIRSVQEWYSVMKDDSNVTANLPLLLQYRPNGIPPHFVGIPVIA